MRKKWAAPSPESESRRAVSAVRKILNQTFRLFPNTLSKNGPGQRVNFRLRQRLLFGSNRDKNFLRPAVTLGRPGLVLASMLPFPAKNIFLRNYLYALKDIIAN